ncbi:hypothetical protein [Chitinophaga pinensis]|uniref:Uncharacterized protein n=1 Tax=Chitinophaga pinensis TaxID=79329 RepID=A0A5C6LM52_9BACT|nr:hypothetical protein [Chitinophaga pinensis]TWV98664.1 hypothetical protein FEF09_20500 [Chitinophaga pinensis]
MIINNSTPYPVFKKGQQLKSSSLKGIVDFAEGEIMDTRMFLEGSGIFYGLDIAIDEQAGTLRLSPGAATTSDGKLFTLEQEVVYNGFSAEAPITLLKKTPVVAVLSTNSENHNEFAYRITGKDPGNPNRTPNTTPYIVLLILTEKTTSNDSCLYGQDNSETSQTKTVQAVLIDKNLIDQSDLDKWFITDNTTDGADDAVINRFGYNTGDGKPYISFENFTSWKNVSDGFDSVCAAAEPLIGASLKQLYDLVKEKLGLNPVNPFNNLDSNLKQLRETVKSKGGMSYPWLYDYYRDLIAAYQELVATDLFSYLSFLPQRDRFEEYIALGSIRAKHGDKDANYRMGLYRPPFADLSINALEKPLLLIKRLQYLTDTAHTRFNAQGFPPSEVIFTPDAGINETLSRRAIPFYYNDPQELSKSWNAELARNRRTFTIPGITDEKDRNLLLANMDGYEFFRIKGHTGALIEPTLDAIAAQRSELHLPFDVKVLYIGEKDDMIKLVKERSAAFSDLTVLLEKIVYDIRCARTCSDNFEESIFGRQFDRNDIGSMFEALVTLFGPLPVDLDKKLEELCSREGTCYDEDKTCCRSHLTALFAVYEEYVRRKDELAGNLLFHLFAEKHPGIEHSGGVPKGGTLILVCGKTDPAFLSEEKKSSLLKLALSNAAGVNIADELENYTVMADFCLPYICCSNKPSINLIFQEAPPVALFSIAEQEQLPEGQGTAVVLKNESLRADTYHWELQDYQGNVLKEEHTTDINETPKFELLIENGVVFTLVLTASREGMNSKYALEITICPQGNVKVTSKGKSSIDWDITKSPELEIEAFPYGGSFGLILQQNDNEQELDPAEYDITWKQDKEHLTLTIQQPQAGIYRLRYTFEDIENCEKGFAILEIHTFVPSNPQPKDKETGTETPPIVPPVASAASTPAAVSRGLSAGGNDAVFNKRILSYRSGINAMSKEDDTLLEDSRWSDTKTFLLASGAPEELHAAYERLQGVLQTGFSKLKVAQKAQMIRLLIYATAYYMDRLIAASPDKVPAIARKLIKAAGESITLQKDGAQQWSQIWSSEGIVTAENEKTVSAYKAMIA